MQLGRRDGTTANRAAAENLPSPFESLTILRSKFSDLGLAIHKRRMSQAAGQQPELPGVPRRLYTVRAGRRHQVAVHLPPRPDMPQEPALVRRGQAAPHLLHMGGHGAQHALPWQAGAYGSLDVLPDQPHQRRQAGGQWRQIPGGRDPLEMVCAGIDVHMQEAGLGVRPSPNLEPAAADRQVLPI